jgi:hypothetical protein
MKNELQTVEAISLLVSCGSNLSQNAPNIMPRSPQKMHIVNTLEILKLIIKSVGIVIYQDLVERQDMHYHYSVM